MARSFECSGNRRLPSCSVLLLRAITMSVPAGPCPVRTAGFCWSWIAEGDLAEHGQSVGTYGVPDPLRVDHGSDFTSHHLERTSIEVRIRLIFSAVGRSQVRRKDRASACCSPEIAVARLRVAMPSCICSACGVSCRSEAWISLTDCA